MPDERPLSHIKTSLISDELSQNEMVDTVHGLFALLNSEIEELQQTLACDCISIWITKCLKMNSQDLASQFTFKYADTVFYYVLDLGGKDTGPLANSLSGLFTKTITILKKYQQNFQDTFKSWIDKTMTIPSDSKQKYMLIEKVGSNIDDEYIASHYLEFCANAIQTMSSNRLANVISKALLTTWKPFLKTQFPEETVMQWLNVWFDTVLKGLKDLQLRSNITTYLMPLLFKQCPSCYTIFLSRIEGPLGLSEDSSTDLLIGTLKIGQDLGLKGAEGTSTKALLPLLTHRNGDFRNRALQLLVGSRRSTDKIDQEIYFTIISENLLALFILENQAVESQNSFISTMRQFLIRIRDSCHTAEKSRSNSKRQKGSDTDNLTQQIDEAKKFLVHLINTAKSYMVPESSFSQHSCSLQLIELIIEARVCPDLNPKSKLLVQSKHMLHNKSKFPFSIEVFDAELIRILLDDHTSNYRYIREHSAQILLSYDPEKLSSMILQHYDVLYNRALALLADLKGRSSEGGAFIIKILGQVYLETERFDSFFEIFQKLVLQLELNVNVLKASGFDDEKPNIAHGALSALSMLCESIIDSKDVKLVSELHSYANQILSNITSIWVSVRHNLQNVAAVQEEDLLLEKKVVTFGWKAVKESSKLLQTLMTMQLMGQTNFLNQQWIEDCASTLMEQLTTIKHRGAFSSVYPCFVALCNLCNNSYPDMPLKWLAKNIEMIQNRDQLISRRSGGIPYLVTAILTSKTANEDIQSNTLEHLLRIAEDPYEKLEDGKRDLPQVHAFNILRQIFTDPALSAHNFRFIGKALNLSLRLFVSKNWSIRNCSMMLFSTVHNRIFGKSEKLLARQYFSLCGDSSKFLAKTLGDLIKTSNYDMMFPILQILSRISFLDGDSNYKEFHLLLSQSVRSRSWKVREIGAKALASIIIANQRIEVAQQMLERTLKSTDNNEAHGNLCSVLELMELISDQKGQLPGTLGTSVADLCVQIVLQNDCWTVRGKATKILQGIERLNKEHLTVLLDFFKDEIEKVHRTLNGERKLCLRNLLELFLRETFDEKLAFSSILEYVLQLDFHDELKVLAIEFLLEHGLSNVILNTALVDNLRAILAESNWRYLQTKVLELALQLPIYSLQLPLQTLGEWYKDQNDRDSIGHALTIMASMDFDKALMNGILDRAQKLLLEENSEKTRKSGLTTVIRVAENQEQASAISSRALMIVYDSLWDDSEELRYMCSEYLASKVELKSSQSPYHIMARFIDVIPTSTHIAESACNYFISCEPRVSECLANAITNRESTDQLFEIEEVNLYKNNIDRCTSSIKLAEHVKDAISETRMENMLHFVREDLLKIVQHIKLMGKDGPAGWLRGRFEFESVYCTIIRAKCIENILKSHEILGELRLLGPELEIHPTIAKLLD